MVTIYGVYRSRASRPLWLLEELGEEFNQIPVMQSYRLPDPAAPDAPLNTASPAFLAINPAGQVPALEDDGFVLTESFAITLYLAQRAGPPLGPRDGREAAQMLRWTLWAATTVEARALDILYHRVGKPPAERDEALVKAAIAALTAPFATLDAALRGDGCLVGGRFTVADLNVAEVIRYAQPAPELFTGLDALRGWIGACQARPAFRRMMARREAEPA